MLIISQTLPFTGKQSEFIHSFKYYFLCSNFLFIRKFVHSFVTFLVQARKVRNINRKLNIILPFCILKPSFAKLVQYSNSSTKISSQYISNEISCSKRNYSENFFHASCITETFLKKRFSNVIFEYRTFIPVKLIPVAYHTAVTANEFFRVQPPDFFVQHGISFRQPFINRFKNLNHIFIAYL